MASKWTYKDYVDNEETLKAKGTADLIKSQRPGEFTYEDYAESDAVKNYYNQWQQNSANKPGEYQSKWQQSLDDTINKILNREKFSYDINGDALYQQYKDQYTTQGKQAMMDTMGQAAAMTGGYGNSYAQTVGQQTYQGYLQQLNDKVPELYQLALDQYNREGDELYNQYGLFSDREETDYGRHRDSVSDWYREDERLSNIYNTEREWDYGLYSDNYSRAWDQHRADVTDWQYDYSTANDEYWNQRNFGYGQYSDDRNLNYNDYRNIIADEQWNKNYQLQQDQLAEQIRANKESERISQLKATQDNDDVDEDEDDDQGSKDYSSWDAGDWESYFAYIRQTDGQAAAEEELSEFTSKGYIPQKFVAMAASGARGGMKGH